jgi:obg-like ATPase 1
MASKYHTAHWSTSHSPTRKYNPCPDPMKKEASSLVAKPLLGRPGNNLKIGIVGVPNVGKSTFFNALTKSSVPAENYPFCTIDPSESRCAVPDARFDWLCQHFKPQSKVPAYLSVIDIAGLVAGAAAGEGLGNAFLSHIKSVDAIFHLSRAFDSDEIAHVEGDVDPVRDLEIIRKELRLKDLEQLKKALEVAKKGLRCNESDKEKVLERDTIAKAIDLIEVQGKDVRHGDWSIKEIDVVNSLYLLTAKPVIYLVNILQEEWAKKKNKHLLRLKQWIDANSPGDLLIPFSAAFEQQLLAGELQESPETGVVSALPKIILAGYNALNLQYFFTAGPDEVRAWTIRKGSKAPQAAGVIHTDFEKGFIMAEVMKFEDLKALGTESAVKAAGKYLSKGREYIVEDGDVIFFKFNYNNASKKK